MFAEFQRLFDRNFAVGFFLPAFVLASVSVLMLNHYVFRVDILSLQQWELLATATVVGLLGLVGGIVLMAFNRDLYRFMEGYGTYNPLRWFGGFERKRYRDIRDELQRLEGEFMDCMNANKAFPVKSQNRKIELLRQLAVEFPDQLQFLLPTPFGNALRSFEVFPRVMYGLDSIPAWGRLLAIIPNEYLELIAGVKAHVDLWVNLGLIVVMLQAEYVGLVVATTPELNWEIVGPRAALIAVRGELNWWIMGLWIVLGTIAPLRATSSACEWGDFVKSAFDVFAPKLREALGIEQPQNRQEEFTQWERFSRALIFRLPQQLPELRRLKKCKGLSKYRS